MIWSIVNFTVDNLRTKVVIELFITRSQTVAIISPPSPNEYVFPCDFIVEFPLLSTGRK